MRAQPIGRPELPVSQRHVCETKVRLNEAQDALLDHISRSGDLPKAAVARQALLLGLSILEQRVRPNRAA